MRWRLRNESTNNGKQNWPQRHREHRGSEEKFSSVPFLCALCASVAYRFSSKHSLYWNRSGKEQTLIRAISLMIIMTMTASVFAEDSRRRASFNADWRFKKDDPAGAEGKLAYAKIKEFVLPTGNAF